MNTTTEPTFIEIENARRRWAVAGKSVKRAMINIHDANPDDPFSEPCWRIDGADDMLSTRDLIAMAPSPGRQGLVTFKQPARVDSSSDTGLAALAGAALDSLAAQGDTIGIQRLAIARLRRDGGTQPRAALDEETICDYAEAMQAGARFPPVIAYYDGTDYWVADGYHRLNAAMRAGQTEIDVDVIAGTQRDAVLYSVGANAIHGLRRTNADKRRSVERLLRDESWGNWADREIARRCNVSDKTVAAVRANLTADFRSDERTYVTKSGSVATMHTAAIGQSAQSEQIGRTPAISSAAQPAPVRIAPTLAELDPELRPDAIAREKASSAEVGMVSVLELERLVSDWAERMFPDTASRHPALFGIKISKERSEHWISLTNAIAGQPYRTDTLRQAINNLYDRLNQQRLAATSQALRASHDAILVERSSLAEQTRTETIQPAAAKLAADLAAGGHAAWSLVYGNVFGRSVGVGDVETGDIIAMLAAQWLRHWLTPGILVEPGKARREITKIMMWYGVTPPWLETQEAMRFALLDCQIDELDEWIASCAHKWASSKTVKENFDEANGWANDLQGNHADDPGAPRRLARLTDQIQRLTDLSCAVAAIPVAGINQNGWYAQIKKLYDADDGRIATICAQTPQPILRYAAAVLPAGGLRNAVLATLRGVP